MSPPALKPSLAALVVLALTVTVLNALKPLYMDDATYYQFAAHIASQPGDPYGFVFADGSQANHVLAPPVLLYWWAAGLRLFGNHPFAWKLWLFPWVLLFVAALARLLRRFAPELTTPLLLMTTFSPIYLPAWNLMLDVPALALGVFGITVFLNACDRDSATCAALAGVAVGLAMQTKYTVFVVPLVMLLYAGMFRRLRLGVVAVATATVLFVSWEIFSAMRYGESHFLCSLHQRDSGFFNRVAHLILPMFGILGGLTPALSVLGLIALRASGRVLVAAAFAALLGYAAIAFVPASVVKPDRLNSIIFGSFGVAGCGIAARAAVRLVRRNSSENDTRCRRADWFLVGWLFLEIAGYFTLSPFAASRRLMGVVLVSTILLGRLAGRVKGVAVPATVAASVLLGLGYYLVDLREALAARTAAADAVRWIRACDPEAIIRFRGDWGFAFYAEQAGLQPLSAKRPQQPGEWLISSGERINTCDASGLETIAKIRIGDALPLRTMPCYYDGRTALEHHEGPRYVAVIARLVAGSSLVRSESSPLSPASGERGGGEGVGECARNSALSRDSIPPHPDPLPPRAGGEGK